MLEQPLANLQLLHGDLVCASDELTNDLPKLAKKAMQKDGMTCDTVTTEEYEKMSKEEFEL